jgi:hypothetical protein
MKLWDFVDWIKSAAILTEQNLGYHNKKPNITDPLIVNIQSLIQLQISSTALINEIPEK